MAPKRKTDDAEGGPEKKKKTPKSVPTPVPRSPNLVIAYEDGEKLEVQWAMPPLGKADIRRNDSAEITRFAPVLYNQGQWNQIRTGQKHFRWPFDRSPVLKSSGGSSREPGGHYELSAAYCDLYNRIKEDTGRNRVPEYPYSRVNFTGAFEGAGNGTALVASESATSPILTLNGDHRVDV